jgi:hypothetical protein
MIESLDRLLPIVVAAAHRRSLLLIANSAPGISPSRCDTFRQMLSISFAAVLSRHSTTALPWICAWVTVRS